MPRSPNEILDRIHDLSHLGRAMCGDALTQIVPMIAQRGGGPAIAELYQAALDVGRWWP